MQQVVGAGPDDAGLVGGARALAMGAVALSVLLSVLDYAVANVALPTIGHDIGATPSSAIWVVNAYQLASLIALLPVASLGEIVGAATLCRVGLVVFVGASALCAVSTNLPMLAGARVLQGLGGACIMGVNVALVRVIYPASQFGRGIALNGLVVATGVALGPTVASAVLSVAHWPWLFWINLPLGAAAFALAVTALPATPKHHRPFDGVSALLLACALGPLVVGLDGLAHGGSMLDGVVPALAGAGCFMALVRREATRPAPLFPVDLLRGAAFRRAFVVGFTGFVASNFFIIAMPFLLEERLGRDAVETGLLMTPWATSVAVASYLIGWVADRARPAVVSSAGLSLTALGFVLLWRMGAHPTDWGICARIALAGFGFGLFQPPNNRALMLTAPLARSGAASGMVSAARLLGQTLGAMMVAAVFAWRGGVDGPVACMGFGALAAAVGVGLSVSRGFRGGRSLGPAL